MKVILTVRHSRRRVGRVRVTSSSNTCGTVATRHVIDDSVDDDLDTDAVTS